MTCEQTQIVSRSVGQRARTGATKVVRFVHWTAACGAPTRTTRETSEPDTTMGKHKTHPKLEQALTRGDLAIRQANSVRATAVLQALGKMVVDASATIGVEASTSIPDGDRIYDPDGGVWPQALLISFDGPVEEADPDEIRKVFLMADTPSVVYRVEWQRADGKLGRHEARPFAMVAFLTDVEVPWSDDEE